MSVAALLVNITLFPYNILYWHYFPLWVVLYLSASPESGAGLDGWLHCMYRMCVQDS